MESIRQWGARLQTAFSQVPMGTKLLIGVLLVVVAAAVWTSGPLTRGPAMAPILDQPLAESDRARIAAYLESQGVRYRVIGDRIEVNLERRADVLARLQFNNLLPRDTSRGFAALIAEKPAWYASSEQNRQRFNLALQEELAAVLGHYPWVHRATVIISHPRQTGFGATHRRPTAAVNIVTTGQPLDQKKANAIAGLVSGAVSEMTAEDVTVIDASAGRQWKVPRSEDAALASAAHEILRTQEQYHREKIIDALRYIPNVIVAVNIEVDVVRRQTESQTVDREKSFELLTRDFSERIESNDEFTGASSSTQRTEKELKPLVSTRHETAMHPGGLPTRISAAVSVPRSFFVSAMPRGSENAPPPTDAELQPIVDEQVQRIRAKVEALVQARDPGQVIVDIYPDQAPMIAEPDAAALEAEPSAVSPAPAPHPWIAWPPDEPFWSRVAVASLGIVALVVVLVLLRKAVGSTSSARSSAEQAAAHPQVARQVGEMIRDDPDRAAALLKRWLQGAD